MANNHRDGRLSQNLNANREPATVTRLVAAIGIVLITYSLVYIVNNSLKSSGYDIYSMFNSTSPISSNITTKTTPNLLESHLIPGPLYPE